jgi:hypothetical protein
VQFSDSLTSAGSAAWRIGTSDAAWVSVENCGGCGVAGWGWQDNGYGAGVPGQVIYFAKSGVHTLRLQSREDGLGIDQIVLSAVKYMEASPGALKNDSTILAATGDAAAPAPAPGPASNEVVLYAASTPNPTGNWRVIADSTAAGGLRLQNANRVAAKVATAAAAPLDYFELTFEAQAGTPYQLWIRGKAESDSWANDSVFVQFDGSVSAAGAAINRIGTSGALWVNLEDCSGCGVSEWGWQDAAYGPGVAAAPVYFARTGTQRIRIQVREDGLGIDQIVLSPQKYLTRSPGALKDDATIVQ